MKKIIIMLIAFFALVACAATINHEIELLNQGGQKPLTITECDIMGWSSDEIIAKKKREGYEFIGATRGLLCYNDLHFELKEETK